ncbi:CRISPR-associated endonuclease Cas2 [Fusobacterium sp.]|uniref:CRISPR-associated endonuclease Cas2 n=1 Tax=Fusobacterium sp. TaxID=68766 RepID=UPI001DBF40C8|nr:CRISPR-associated endonuclease Cas2 [Fusobacterium sp.]MBS5790228.1 CRISPR-associated endonuclease Cas2 [Fusobacterium sp.]
MKYIISYDISSSKIRKEFSDFLLSENFIRIQKSVFIGNIKKKYLFKKIQDEKDSILLCPLCENDLKESYFIGKTFDTEDLELFEKFLFF